MSRTRSTYQYNELTQTAELDLLSSISLPSLFHLTSPSLFPISLPHLSASPSRSFILDQRESGAASAPRRNRPSSVAGSHAEALQNMSSCRVVGVWLACVVGEGV